MNYNMLTAKEILRIAQPETELEIRLFDILESEQDEVESVRAELQEYYATSCENCDSLSNDLADAETDRDEFEERIKELEKLLDDNNIEHVEVVA